MCVTVYPSLHPGSQAAAEAPMCQIHKRERQCTHHGKRCAWFTLRTSCLHFSTLSCNFFSCSGFRDGSTLLLLSRDIANFSSLHAAW